jgi:hypothetical protein
VALSERVRAGGGAAQIANENGPATSEMTSFNPPSQMKYRAERNCATKMGRIAIDKPTVIARFGDVTEVLQVMRELAHSGVTMLVVTHEYAVVNIAPNDHGPRNRTGASLTCRTAARFALRAWPRACPIAP